MRSESKAAKQGLDRGGRVGIVKLDITAPPAELAAALKGADAVISCVGFVPGNILKMGVAAHAVDNVGTWWIRLRIYEKGTFYHAINWGLD